MVYTHECICIWLHLHRMAYAFVFIYIDRYIYPWIYMYIYIFRHVSIWLYLSIYIYIYRWLNMPSSSYFLSCLLSGVMEGHGRFSIQLAVVISIVRFLRFWCWDGSWITGMDCPLHCRHVSRLEHQTFPWGCSKSWLAAFWSIPGGKVLDDNWFDQLYASVKPQNPPMFVQQYVVPICPYLQGSVEG